MRSSCSATTSAMVWLRSAALRMYAATCVSNATGIGRASGASPIPSDQERLDLMADDGRADIVEERPQAQPRRRPFDRDRAPVDARQCQGDRRAPSRPRVVEHEPGARPPTGRPATVEGGDPFAGVDLDARWVGDRGCERRRQVLGRVDGSPAPSPVRRPFRSRRRGLRGGSGTRHGIEVERQLEPAALGRRSRRPGRAPSPTAAPPRRPGRPARIRRWRRRAAPRPSRPADSPVIAGRRSMSVRNSNSRNRRMTVSRS